MGFDSQLRLNSFSLFFSLFCRLASLLRIKNNAFGSVAKITVHCLQGLTQALDLRFDLHLSYYYEIRFCSEHWWKAIRTLCVRVYCHFSTIVQTIYSLPWKSWKTKDSIHCWEAIILNRGKVSNLQIKWLFPYWRHYSHILHEIILAPICCVSRLFLSELR